MFRLSEWIELMKKEYRMPLTGDKKPDDFVPSDKLTPELRKQMEEIDKQFPPDKKEEKEEKKNG
jgi:hypothetical protein